MISQSVILTKSEENVNRILLNLRDVATCFSNEHGVFTEFTSQIENLEVEWSKFIIKYHGMLESYTDLKNENKVTQQKCKTYKEKLNFVKDNSENFKQLKTLYDNIKKLGEDQRSVKSVQVEVEENLEPISRHAIREAKETLRKMKDIIKKREEAHDENLRKIDMMAKKIAYLEKQNAEMSKILKQQFSELRRKNTEILNTKKNESCYKQLLSYVDNRSKESSFLNLGEEICKIKDMKSSLANGNKGQSKVCSTGDGENYRNSKLGLKSREVEVLEKIKDEIQKRSDSIQEKIDKFKQILCK